MPLSSTNGEQALWLSGNEWGPHKHGAELIVDGPTPSLKGPTTIDVETDEQDGFVGLALCEDGKRVYYYTSLDKVSNSIASLVLDGHNLKGDLHWLKKWGVNVSETNLGFDTMIASYVINPTRDSHGLKPLASSLLQMLWPTYEAMTTRQDGKRGRVTLKDVPVERVARYCGMDCLATFRLKEYLWRTMSPENRRVFSQLEMPLNRLLYKMEAKGVQISLSYLDELDKEFAEKIKSILDLTHSLTEPEIQKLLVQWKAEQLKEKWEVTGLKGLAKGGRLNPGSWQQKRLLLKFLGMELETTDKKTLVKYKGKHELIGLLLQHSEFAKLYNAFITAFKELPTLPIIHTTFSQVSESSDDEDDAKGLKTGRLSSKAPNLQQIPARTENGQKLRKLFIPRSQHTFIVADYSQIELRVAAHFSHDPILCGAFKSGKDVHDETAKALGVERFYGKTGNFLLAFGGYHQRLMDALNIDEQKAKEFFDVYWRKFAVLKLWKQRAVDLARARGGVKTLYGRWIPVANLNSPNRWIRSKAERFAISGIVQGSAADIMKLAMLECDKNGYTPLLTVHDELVFELPGLNCSTDGAGKWRDMADIEDDMSRIESIMEDVVKLDVPLEVVIGHGPSWGNAKH